ncbi:MAG: pentose kinase, partial [Verrucomicrobia bacterium]|nr:pentose kinase [Verrucomicrobiota bacterium]
SRGNKLERLVASGGGAKTRLWLEIKASVYGCPILTPTDPECGVLGCAMLAGVGAGIFPSIDEAVRRLVRYDQEIQPDPSRSERYERMGTFFNRVYLESETYWNEMEGL